MTESRLPMTALKEFCIRRPFIIVKSEPIEEIARNTKIVMSLLKMAFDSSFLLSTSYPKTIDPPRTIKFANWLNLTLKLIKANIVQIYSPVG